MLLYNLLCNKPTIRIKAITHIWVLAARISKTKKELLRVCFAAQRGPSLPLLVAACTPAASRRPHTMPVLAPVDDVYQFGSEHDLVGHRGSCLYREKISKEEKMLRRAYMTKPDPPSDEVTERFDKVFLAPSPAAYWTARKKLVRQLADSTSTFDSSKLVQVPKYSGSLSSGPSRENVGLADRAPITMQEHASYYALARLKSGTMGENRVSSAFVVAADDMTESIGGLGSQAACGPWPTKPRSIDHLSETEVRKRAERMLRVNMAKRRGAGGTIV